jgi:ATP-dependent Clp protease adaptor protein ClpS
MPQPGIIETPDTQTDSALDQPWHVIVYNDPINLMSYVTLVFMRVFGYPRERAERHMLEVHNHGRPILWTGAREQAEHYVHQLHSYQLLARLERAA